MRPMWWFGMLVMAFCTGLFCADTKHMEPQAAFNNLEPLSALEKPCSPSEDHCEYRWLLESVVQRCSRRENSTRWHEVCMSTDLLYAQGRLKIKSAQTGNPNDSVVTHPSNELSHYRDLAFFTGGPSVSVFGHNGLDDRRIVHTTTSRPWSMIGFLDVGCTGAMIGPRHVLTAAHCLYDPSLGRFSDKVSFAPGANGVVFPFGRINGKSVVVSACWAVGIRECDFAVVILELSVGYLSGWFNVVSFCPQSHLVLNTAGYPVDKPSKTLWKEACGITPAGCVGSGELPGSLFHKCDVEKGMSGAPLWDSSGSIRAVHSGFLYGKGNVAAYVTKYTFQAIERWLQL